MDSEKKTLLISDAETAQRAILDMISLYPHFPSGFKPSNQTILWNNISDKQSIGVFPVEGGVYLDRYVDGSYTAQMPFQIIYKSNPTTNKANIANDNLLDDLAKWLEKKDFTLTDKNFSTESITRTSNVFSGTRDEKETALVINMSLKYFYGK